MKLETYTYCHQRNTSKLPNSTWLNSTLQNSPWPNSTLYFILQILTSGQTGQTKTWGSTLRRQACFINHDNSYPKQVGLLFLINGPQVRCSLMALVHSFSAQVKLADLNVVSVIRGKHQQLITERIKLQFQAVFPPFINHDSSWPKNMSNFVSYIGPPNYVLFRDIGPFLHGMGQVSRLKHYNCHLRQTPIVGS